MRSPLAIMFSSLSMLTKVSTMAKNNLAIFSDELKRAFTKQTIERYNATVNTLYFGMKHLEGQPRARYTRFKIIDDPDEGTRLFQMINGVFRPIHSAFQRSADELYEMLRYQQRGAELIGDNIKIQLTRKRRQEEERTRETTEEPEDFSDVFSDIKGYAKKSPLVKGINTLFGKEEIEGPGSRGKKLLTFLPSMPFRFLEKTGEGLKSVGIKAWNGMGKLLNVPPAKWTALGKGLSPLMGAGLKAGAIGILIDIVMTLLDALNPFKPVMEALTTIFGIYGEILGTAFIPLIEKLYEVMLSDTTISLVMSLANVFSNLVVALFPLLNVLAPLGNIMLSVLIIPLNLFATILNALAIPLGIVTNVLAIILGWIADFIAIYSANIQPVFNAIAAFFAAIVSLDFNSIVKAAKNIFIEIVNAWIRIINSVFKINIKEIPKLAEGGLVTKPTLALIGEKGPEIVTPLNKLKNTKGDITINIYGDVSEEKLYKLKHESLIMGIY